MENRLLDLRKIKYGTTEKISVKRKKGAINIRKSVFRNKLRRFFKNNLNFDDRPNVFLLIYEL